MSSEPILLPVVSGFVLSTSTTMFFHFPVYTILLFVPMVPHHLGRELCVVPVCVRTRVCIHIHPYAVFPIRFNFGKPVSVYSASSGLCRTAKQARRLFVLGVFEMGV